jgi:hypothetical protein
VLADLAEVYPDTGLVADDLGVMARRDRRNLARANLSFAPVQGRHRLAEDLLGPPRPGRHYFFVEHDDAGDDETPDASSPRPRNPAGSANTAWTGRKYLATLEIPRRRRR